MCAFDEMAEEQMFPTYEPDDFETMNQNEANDYLHEGDGGEDEEPLGEREAQMMEFARNGFFETLPI